MLTFITIVLLTSFISLCFFKKRFWENRYLILFIIASVALIATLIINFSVRSHLQTKTEIVYTKSLYTFYVQDSIFQDTLKTPYIKGYDYYNNHKAREFFKSKDSLHQIPVTVLLYTRKMNDDYDNIYIGTFSRSDRQNYNYLKNIYLAPSNSDTVAYRCRKKVTYDVSKSNWIAGFSMPPVQIFDVLYIPPREYAMIPDSLIRKIPF